MLQLNLSSIPKKLEQVNLQKPILVLEPLKTEIIEQLQKPPNKHKINLQNSLNRCLLLTYFLLNDKINFEGELKNIKAKEIKTNEKELLYFDLSLLLSAPRITLKDEFLNKFEYDQLVRNYVKWNLLIPNRLKFNYEAQIKHLRKSDWNGTPSNYLLLLELIIDWLYRLPSKAIFLNAIENKLNQVSINLNQFWGSRQVDLTRLKKPLSLIKVAIWDTGVDKNSIRNISTNLSLSFDQNCKLTQESLMPLNNINEKEWELYKGFIDLKAANKSKAANYFLKKLAQYEGSDMIRLKSIINQLIVHCHGTAVASVAAQENPNIEIVPIRISFDPNQAFPTLYTAKRIENEIKMHQIVFNWIQRHKIPIVNMSWNIRKQDIDTSLLNTGLVNKKERASLAKKLFSSLRESLYNGIKTCSNTLFVIGAGNSNSIVEEEGAIPSTFKLPNLIAIGAVNHKGKRTGFTTIGENVQLYANGSYVNTTIPTGYKCKSSGTSIAAPQVCNLAAIMLSIHSTLSPITIKKYLLDHADRMLDEEILVMNPKKTIEAIKRLN